MIQMIYMRSLAMCCLGYLLSARQRRLVAKLGWPLEDEKEAAVGSLQSQIRPGGESRVVMKYNDEENILQMQKHKNTRTNYKT